MKYTYASVLALYAASASAQANATGELGVGPYANASLFQNSQRAASKSVPFSLYYPSTNDAPAPQWTWTVSLNTADVPNSDIPNAQALNTRYSFAWPNGGSLRQAVADNAGQTSTNHFCVTVVDSLFPSDSTNDYDANDEDDPDDFTQNSCTSALRSRCTDRILEVWRDADPDVNGCRGSNVNLDHIHNCEWEVDGYSAQTYDLLANQSRAAAGTFPLQSGAGFAHITTEAYNGDNMTYVEQERYRLQMVVIESGNILTPLCMRVDTSEKARDQATGAAEVSAASNLFAGSWLLAACASALVAFFL